MSNKVIESVESFTDFTGREVRVGDHVVYATVSGRSPVQKYAVVEKIELVEPDYGIGWGDRRKEPAELRSIRVGVRELSNGRGFARWDTRVYDSNYKRLDDKPARTTYPMRENIVLVQAQEG